MRMKPPRLDRNDMQFFVAAIVVPITLWWIFTGRRKYGVKGMS